MARVRKAKKAPRRANTAGSKRRVSRPSPQRQDPNANKMRQYIRMGVLVAFVFGFIGSGVYSGYYLWSKGYFNQRYEELVRWTHTTMAKAGFVVQDIYVYGRNRTDKDKLELYLPFEIGEPLFSYDLERIGERLETLPWVASASVQRHLPARINIILKERHPLALWQMDTDVYLIDQRGQIIPSQDVDAYNKQMLVVGPGANLKAQEFLAMLSLKPEIMERVVAGIWVGGRRWNLLIDNGVFVNLPEENVVKAYQELAKLQEEKKVLQKNIRVLDMRIEDRYILELPDSVPKGPLVFEQKT